jgi:hypothetical protein
MTGRGRALNLSGRSRKGNYPNLKAEITAITNDEMNELAVLMDEVAHRVLNANRVTDEKVFA